MSVIKNMILIALSLLLSLYAICSYSWNVLGHMVVAQIAYEYLTPETKAKVDVMVADLGKEYPEITAFYQLGPWADFLRSQKIDIFSHWHYTDLAFSADGTPVKKIEDNHNVVWVIQQIQPIVGNSKANPYERARFLAFLVHTVADIHQPLHTASRISSTTPDGDKGGNLYYIKYPAVKPQTMALHKLWDQGIDVFLGDDVTSERVVFLSHQITSLYSQRYFDTKVSDMNIGNWAVEGFQSATSFVYATPEKQLPSDEYLQTSRQMVQQKAALAGYRLAHMLNQLLSDQPKRATSEW